MAQEILLQETFFSQIVGIEIDNFNEQKIGKLIDLAVRWDGASPIVTCVKFAKGSNQHFDSSIIDHWDKNRLVLKIKSWEELTTRSLTAQEIYVGKGLLDKQIIDLQGVKLVRVNDIKLAWLKHDDQQQLVLSAIDIGIRGLFRRLGIEWLVSKRPNRFVDWQAITPLENPLANLQLRESIDKLAAIHPADLAEMMAELDKTRQLNLLRKMANDRVAAILTEIALTTQVALIDEFEIRRAAKILNEMPAAVASDILRALSDDKSSNILQFMKQSSADVVRKLMAYSAVTTGAMMTTEYLVGTPNLTVAEAINKIRQQAAKIKKINYIYVIDNNGQLQGVLSLRKIIMANPAVHLSEVMQTNIRSVTDQENPRQALDIAIKYGIVAIPVIDDKQKLAGIITVTDLLAEFIPNHSKVKTFSHFLLASQKQWTK